MNEASLREAFAKTFDGFRRAESKAAFLSFFDERALFVDEDNPVPMDKAGFADHLDFHTSGVWESIGWKPRDEAVKVFGTTGLVTGHFTVRGKPKNAGFRQRHGNFSVICAWDASSRSGRGLKLAQSPLLSHRHHMAPGYGAEAAGLNLNFWPPTLASAIKPVLTRVNTRTPLT